MCKHPRMQRRGAVYWFRCHIPANLTDHYGKQEILESLRTRDCKKALRLVRTRSELQEQEFESTSSTSRSNRSLPPTSLISTRHLMS